MTDYGMPEADTAALDKAYTEESVRRAMALTVDLYDAATDPSVRAKTQELSSLLYRLGIHLDATAGFGITGPPLPTPPDVDLYARCADCRQLIDHIRHGWYPMPDDTSLCHLCGLKRGLAGLIPAEQG